MAPNPYPDLGLMLVEGLPADVVATLGLELSTTSVDHGVDYLCL